MKTFKHGFTEPITALQVNEMAGYMSALRGLYNQLAEMTEFKPEKRMVDAVILLDMISATSDELTPLMESFNLRLESFNGRNTL